ncbi:MAG: ABC transporter permease, partial [Planctomycetota bacterium]
MEEKNGILSKVLCTGFFLLLIAAVAAIQLEVFLPSHYQVPKDPNREYNRKVMKEALTPESVTAAFATIADLGSRSLGQPGHAAAEAHIRDLYKNAGLEVHEQELETVHPVTEEAAIYDEAGTKLPVVIYPAYPNNLQPQTTGKKGITGEIILVSEKSLAGAKTFHGKIALIDLSTEAPKAQGNLAANYIALGFDAVLYTHPEGEEKFTPETTLNASTNIPVNYVAAFASPDALSLAGKTVTLKVRTHLKALPNRNLIGILRAQEKTSEAVVVPVSYDGFTSLPTLNHSSFNALQMAIQEKALSGMVSNKAAIRRDVIFVATASDMMERNSQNQLLRTIGLKGDSKQRTIVLNDSLTENTPKLAAVNELLTLFTDEAFGLDPDVTLKSLAPVSADAKAFLKKECSYILKSEVLRLSEDLLQARILFEKEGKGDTQSPLFKAFRTAKGRYDRSNTVASYPMAKYLRQPNEGFDLREKLLQRMKTLQAFHSTREDRLKQDLALNKLFSQYENFITFAPALNPSEEAKAPEVLSFFAGGHTPYGDQAMAFKGVLEGAVQELALTEKVRVDFFGSKQSRKIGSKLGGLLLHGDFWSKCAYPGFSIINPEHSYKEFANPVRRDLGAQLSTIQSSLQVYGETLLSIACGNGVFPGIRKEELMNYTGNVYAAGVGNSIVPNYPMAGAIVSGKWHGAHRLAQSGKFARLILQADPYGRYEAPFALSYFSSMWEVTPVAASYNEDGIINFFKDEGDSAQKIYKSIGLDARHIKDVNLVVSRSNAVAILDMINPQTLKSYAGATYIRKQGLAPFGSTCVFKGGAGILDFVPPEETFFVTLKAGAADNELVQETRAFMLNVPADFEGDPEKEIDGLGYLVQDTPILYHVADEVARSMIFLNEKRLDLQRRFSMADEMTLAFQEKSKELADASLDTEDTRLSRSRKASSSVTYSTLNHPIIRTSVSEAVWGILWYMGLLVPFVFFFEKLVFAFTDIRKALAVQAVTFLVVFFLLRLLHPAFEMIRSSVMILLGFVIILISGGITFILSGKFRENLEALQQAQGQVKGAEGNKIGIIITAFMLGLNNMHRRKVRTGLTCATLVLLTFVMICFTSVQSDIVDTTTAVAKTHFQGILIKNEEFAPISAGEISALRAKYGHSYEVVTRSMFVGTQTWGMDEKDNPSIQVIRGEGEEARSFTAKSCLFFDQKDPIQSKLPLLEGSTWFTEKESLLKEGPYPIIISDLMAKKLGFTPEGIAKEKPQVDIGGLPYIVRGVFDAAAFERVISLDGESLLPFDVDGMQKPKTQGSATVILADKEDPRLAAENVFLALNSKHKIAPQAVGSTLQPRNTAALVVLGDVPYKIARQEVDSYLEQSGKTTYYGLDGVSYLGKRARESSLAGLIDMLIPLIIAGLTVLNTMKGSVYERKDEIFVYNAVGIAPRYVFFMFIAEAVVYAVMGALLGYLLSQGTGRILTELGWTGGLNMNFTSLATVYASLTITVAVFLSTWFPARSAMQ